jgi:hypothetical protein
LTTLLEATILTSVGFDRIGAGRVHPMLSRARESHSLPSNKFYYLSISYLLEVRSFVGRAHVIQEKPAHRPRNNGWICDLVDIILSNRKFCNTNNEPYTISKSSLAATLPPLHTLDNLGMDIETISYPQDDSSNENGFYSLIFPVRYLGLGVSTGGSLCCRSMYIEEQR